MDKEHRNTTLLSKLDLRDLDACAALFSDGFVWHYFNPKLPELEGHYVGVEGLKTFFSSIGRKTQGTFSVEPVSIKPLGDELVVAHVRDTMDREGNSITIDVAVVWRIVDGLITEAWDIPSAFTLVKK